MSSLFKRPKIEIPPAPKPPPQPTVYKTPFGRQVQKKLPTGELAWVYEESPEQKAAREQREALRKKFLSELGVVTPEREKQLSEFAEQYKKELLRYSLPTLEQTLIGRGLGGSSIYKEAVGDLVRRAAEEAVLQKEQLKRADEQAKLAALQAVEGGLSAEAARALQTAGLASADLARRAALQQSLWRSMLESQIARANLAGQYQSGMLGSASSLAAALAMAAILHI